jgi:hypothetical protein
MLNTSWAFNMAQHHIPPKNRMQGGKLVGQGTYGCVFSPPLRCSSKQIEPRKDHIGKIGEYFDVKNEIQAAKDLHNVVGSQYFILPDPTSLCVPAPMNKQSEPDIDNCEAIERRGTKNMVHYQMRFGGLPIRVVLRKSNNYSFYTFMTHLLEMGSTLLLNGYVHGDFHMNNVLMLEDHRPRLIDFGRSFAIKTLTRQVIDAGWTEYSPGFSYEAPDMSLIISLQGNVSIAQCIEDMKSQKSSMINLERVLGVSRDKQIVELINFWDSSKAVVAKDWLAYWKMYWYSFDAWAIGAILIELLRIRLLSKGFEEEWSKRQEVIGAVIKGLLHSSPRQRLDCVEALALVNPMHPIVKRAKDWLKSRRN